MLYRVGGGITDIVSGNDLDSATLMAWLAARSRFFATITRLTQTSEK
jgi:hypothetical protein